MKYTDSTVGSATEWVHFRWEIHPADRRVFFRKSAQPASAEKEIMHLRNPDFGTVPDVVADLNSTYGTSIVQLPTLYNYFPSITGFRFFFNNLKKPYLANLSITTTADPASNAQLQQTAAFQVKAFPIPASDVLHLSWSQESPTAQLWLYNMQGQVVESKTLRSGEALQVAELPEGSYIGKLLGRDGSIGYFRFIKDYG